jgi:thiosulfate reductase cytochrome b subunit
MDQATNADSGSTRRGRWFKLVWIAPVLIVVAVAAVYLANVVRTDPAVAEWISRYPGDAPLPEGAPVGIPIWIGWQHFLNAFLLVLIVRSGWQLRTTQRPPAYWTSKPNRVLGAKRQARKISIHLWLHQVLDVVWLANGLAFVAALIISGHWVRIVPTSWEVIPNAASAALQYVSFDWPAENGWVNYNALQQLSYCGVVFILAPLAAVTGARMSDFWPARAALNRTFKIEWARAVHYPVMLLFVLFAIVHVALVLATGALRNLNHMYASLGPDDRSWWGAGIFAGSLIVIAGAVIAAQPVVLRPIAALFGTVSR